MKGEKRDEEKDVSSTASGCDGSVAAGNDGKQGGISAKRNSGYGWYL